jgi:hypothetical protein
MSEMGGISESEVNISKSALKVESVSQNLAKETIKKSSHCLYISGIAWSVNGVKEGLEGEYGKGNADVFGSISSPDYQNPRRFEQMADIIQNYAKDGLDVFAFSLGAAELGRVIKVIKDRDKSFFENKENVDHLNIILGSPSGFNKGIIGGLRYLARAIKFNREEGSSPIIAKGDTLKRGMDAIAAFPPKGVSRADLDQAMHEAMPEISQDREGIEKITLEEGENYTPHLSEEHKKQVELYSGAINLAIENKNYDGLRHLVSAYGKLLKKPLDEMYSGKFDAAEGRQEMKELGKLTMRETVGGQIELLRIMNNALGSVPMQQLEELQRKGVNIKFIVPEFDTYVKVEQLIEFLGGSRETVLEKMKIVPATHQLPSVERPKIGKLIQKILAPSQNQQST